jgi:hypothetical protein
MNFQHVRLSSSTAVSTSTAPSSQNGRLPPGATLRLVACVDLLCGGDRLIRPLFLVRAQLSMTDYRCLFVHHVHDKSALAWRLLDRHGETTNAFKAAQWTGHGIDSPTNDPNTSHPTSRPLDDALGVEHGAICGSTVQPASTPLHQGGCDTCTLKHPERRISRSIRVCPT